jgi:hypothetical protein
VTKGQASGEQSSGARAGTATLRPATPSKLDRLPDERAAARDHRLFRRTLVLVNWLLLISIAISVWAAVREYSTRRYVDAFSDAIVPVSGSPEQKIQAILDWMAHPPARFSGGIVGTPDDRDPLDTLNYQVLLQVCGTATNAFINLADTSDLRARRLLLLDANRSTKHVAAEVFVNGRWIVVDPTFRVILRGPDGQTLTRSELADPAVFAAATRNIPHYDPSYSFERTAHIRLAGIKFVGNPARKALNYLLPSWQNSVAISLVAERGSLAAMIVAILAALFLIVVRFSLRWYGRRRLHVDLIPVPMRLQRAYRAFVDPAS